MKAIYFDMDGTIADLYGVNGWLDYIIEEQATPYEQATPMVNMQVLARLLNGLQKKGYTIGVVSWLAKNGREEYNNKVTLAKKEWLEKHLKSVKFDEIHIVKYGTEKQKVVNYPMGFLFDDETPNRDKWSGDAFGVDSILDILKEIKG